MPEFKIRQLREGEEKQDVYVITGEGDEFTVSFVHNLAAAKIVRRMALEAFTRRMMWRDVVDWVAACDFQPWWEVINRARHQEGLPRVTGYWRDAQEIVEMEEPAEEPSSGG